MIDRPTKYERLRGEICWSWEEPGAVTEVFARAGEDGRIVWGCYEASEIHPVHGPGRERNYEISRAQARALLEEWGALREKKLTAPIDSE
jgi:hypothetical protein